MSKPSKPAKPDVALDPRLGAILRIASKLRDLPRAEFKSNLKTRLASSALGAALQASKPVGGKPLVTEEDIYARIQEMADEPRLVAHDVNAALDGLPEMSMKFLAPVNNTTLIVSRASSPTSWERHPGGDEMIYVVEGAADIVTLTDDGWAAAMSRHSSAGAFASSDAPFSQRMTYTFEDEDQTMSGKGQLSYDDVNWDDDLEITYRRAS